MSLYISAANYKKVVKCCFIKTKSNNFSINSSIISASPFSISTISLLFVLFFGCAPKFATFLKTCNIAINVDGMLGTFSNSLISSAKFLLLIFNSS